MLGRDRLVAVLGVAASTPPVPGQAPDDDRKELEKKIEQLAKQQAEMQRQLEKLKRELAARRPPRRPTPTSPTPAAAGAEDRAGHEPRPDAVSRCDLGRDGAGDVGDHLQPGHLRRGRRALLHRRPERGALGFYSHSDNFTGEGVGGIPEISTGFNLGETEFAFSAAVDPYFDALAILTVSREEVGMEEAWIRTRRLLPGLSIKAGKFFSDIGYVNKQHPHQWDFVDQNLPYSMFFEGGINEAGVQVEYLPKTPVYILIGGEALQGTNPGMANYLGPDENPALSSKSGPRLFTGFFKVSPDIGYSDALQLGVSGGYDTMFQDQVDDVASQGTSWFTGFDAVFKHDDPRPFGQGDLTLQGEFFLRDRSPTS